MRPSSQPNRRLRVRQTAPAVTGGCKVLENPDRRGDEAVLFWRSELLVDLVRLVAAPAGTDSQLRFDPRRWAGQLAMLATDEGLHLITYIRLLDADADGVTWEEASRSILHIDPETEPERARRAHRTHLARAQWMTRVGYRHILTDEKLRKTGDSR